VTEEEHERAADEEQLRRDMEFAQGEDIVGEVEAETANATGGAVDPAEVDVTQDPELVRIGLRTLLRSIMRHLGREETERAYERAFGVSPSGRVHPEKLPALSELRRRRGYSKREFARLAGSSTRALQDAERGERAPRPETMRKYAKALGVRPWEVREFAQWLFGEGKQEDQQKEELDE
jgi:DNA-binding XRE family transcriptional regulator